MSDPTQANPSPAPAEQEVVWTYRGYKMRVGEFNTAMVHLFRAEIQRANVWRQRLDTTTNWAVVSTGAAISFAFSPSSNHAVIILTSILITLFLWIEARRYRYYELWSYRVRLMETDFYGAMLVPPFQPSMDWAESLAESLLHPTFPISMWEAFGRRLRRNFLWIYMVLGIAWLAKVWWLVPGGNSWEDFQSNASIGDIPGVYIAIGWAIAYASLVIIGLLTTRLHQATGEVFPRFGEDHLGLWATGQETPGTGERAWFRLSRRRQQLMALIITDQAKPVADQILAELRRGVTAFQGTGMFTGKNHQILMVALTVTEVNHLKQLVSMSDPNAFMVVTPAQEVLGRGFASFSSKKTQPA